MHSYSNAYINRLGLAGLLLILRGMHCTITQARPRPLAEEAEAEAACPATQVRRRCSSFGALLRGAVVLCLCALCASCAFCMCVWLPARPPPARQRRVVALPSSVSHLLLLRGARTSMPMS